MGFKKGDKVWYKGLFSDSFSLRGVIEVCRVPFGVRLENGNFVWADFDQLQRR